MSKEYDFSQFHKNPYDSRMGGQITIRLDEDSSWLVWKIAMLLY